MQNGGEYLTQHESWLAYQDGTIDALKKSSGAGMKFNMVEAVDWQKAEAEWASDRSENLGMRFRSVLNEYANRTAMAAASGLGNFNEVVKAIGEADQALYEINQAAEIENLRDVNSTLGIDAISHLPKGLYTLAEMAFAAKYPYARDILAENANVAYSAQNAIFQTDIEVDNAADAFRHAFFSAMNARDLGEGIAREFGFAHEVSFSENNSSRTMDLFNNEQGFKIYSITSDKSNNNLMKNVFNHLEHGGLIMIKNGTFTKTTWP